MKKVWIGGTLLIASVICCYAVAWGARGISEVSLASIAGQSGPAISPAPEGAVVVPLNLQKVAQEVAKRNAVILNEHLRAQMSREQITAEKGIFEPAFQTAFSEQKIHIPNSTYDILISQQAEYKERSKSLDMSLGGLVPTGTQWNIKYIAGKKNSSIIEQYRPYLFEYADSLKFELQQPLLRGFGFDATKAKINLAKVQSDIDQSKFEQKLMELIGVTIHVYWRLYGTQKIAQSWRKSLTIAEETLRDVELRAASGKIANTEVMEARSHVNLRRAEALRAMSKVIEAQDQLMTLLNVSASDNRSVQLVPADSPFGNYADLLDPEEYVKIAKEKWPEYRVMKKAVEKERIQVKNARNQVLPKLDLVGSVTTNSLSDDRGHTFRQVADDKFVGWSIGLKLNVPILGNMQARSGLSIAEMRARQTENDLNAFLRNLSNSLNTKVEELRSLKGQLMEYEKGLAVKEQLLEIDRTKFKAGRAKLKTLFDQEEDYIDYQRRVFSAVVNYKVAEATLEIAMGRILEKYDIDKGVAGSQAAALAGDVKEILR